MMMEVGTARAEVAWMREHAAAAVLGAEQPEELRQRLQTDGYLLVRGLIRPDAVARARARIVATLREAGAIAESDDPAECRVAPPDQQEGRPSKQYRAGSTRRPYDPHALLQQPELLRVTDGPELHEMFGVLFGEAPAMTGPQVFRPTPPGSFSGYHSETPPLCDTPAPPRAPLMPLADPRPLLLCRAAQWTTCTWGGAPSGC